MKKYIRRAIALALMNGGIIILSHKVNGWAAAGAVLIAYGICRFFESFEEEKPK